MNRPDPLRSLRDTAPAYDFPDPLASQGAFIRCLRQALVFYLDEATINGTPEWTCRYDRGVGYFWVPSGPCVQDIEVVFNCFYLLVCTALVHFQWGQNPRYPRRTMEQLLTSLAALPHWDAHFLNTLAHIDPKEVWDATVANAWVIGTPNLPAPSASFLSRGKAWLIRCALHPDMEWESFQIEAIKKLLIQQPYYVRRPTDLSEQCRVAETGDDGEFPALAEALRPFLAERTEEGVCDGEALVAVFHQFVLIASAVLETWRLCNPTDEDSVSPPPYFMYINAYLQIEAIWHKRVEDPFSETPYRVRQVLTSVNIKGCWDLLWAVMWKIATDARSFTYASTGLRDWLTNNASSSVVDPTGDMSRVVAGWGYVNGTLDIGQLFWAPGHRVYGPDEVELAFYADDFGRFPDYQIELRRLDDDLSSRLNLQDAELVPVGPPIETLQYMLAELYPAEEELCTICLDGFEHPDFACVQPRTCSHCFHFDCIDQYINSGTAASNTCPNCRTRICARRPRIPASQE